MIPRLSQKHFNKHVYYLICQMTPQLTSVLSITTNFSLTHISALGTNTEEEAEQ